MKTPQQALESLRLNGKTVTGWARENNFDTHLVRGVIYGRIKGRWGQSHRIAVALGIKCGEIHNA